MAAETDTLRKLYIALKKAQDKVSQLEAAHHEPIAIIGMACRFPGGANSPEKYWEILKNGIDTITDVPSNRWEGSAYYDSDLESPGKMYTTKGGFLEVDIKDFDAAFFGLSPKETNSLDPQQRLLLEVSWEALENAAIDVSTLIKSRTGVFIGISSDDYTLAHRHSGDLSKINAYSMSGTTFSTASGRISYAYGFEGPNMPIDTACSSSLVALHVACQSLRLKESHLALVGGVNLMLAPQIHIAFSKLQAISPDGKCKTFDALANGYARGEGCGFVVLKRLTDALNDSDHILAVVKGSAVNQDGKSSGFTVPNGSAQQKVIQQALKNANLSIKDIDYIEAHGTGTSLGDPIEIQAIGNLLKKGYIDEKNLLVGTAKTNVGHLEPAAGMAGLIKVIQSLLHEEIPPNLHFKQPNPHIPWDELPIKVPTQSTPWLRSERPRIAGISGFGYSGTNAHVIVAQAPVMAHKASQRDNRPTHLLTLSAKHENALTELATHYIDYLSSEDTAAIADICYTANVGRTHFENRLAVVGKSREEIKQKLSDYITSRNAIYKNPEIEHTSKIAFLFTGQGAQYVNMGRQLYETQPTFRKTLERCDEILRDYLEQPLLEVLYSSPDNKLDETAYTQPALFALEYALAQLWQSWGIKPDIVMGHSVGEYVAACIAGVFSLEDGLKLIAERARLMQALPQNGEMVSVIADEARVRAAIEPYTQKISIAAINGPESLVFSGERQTVQTIVTTLQSIGIKTKNLQVSHAFHSPLMEPMLTNFEQVARQITYSSPKIGIVSNVTGEFVTDEMGSPEYWCRHVRQPVKFAASMETLHQQGISIFIEIGPKATLLGMGHQCLPDDVGIWLPSLRAGQEDWQQLLQSLSTLYVHGIPIDWSGFDQDYSRRKVMLPTYPFQRQPYWMDISRQPLALPQVTWLHPLLTKKSQSPLVTVFESRFSAKTMPFLEDHRIFGKLIVSGASHISLLLGANELTFGTSECLLEDIVFPQALVIPDDEERTVQLVITPAENGLSAPFKLISLEKDNSNAWTTHATGKITQSPITNYQLPITNFSEVWARCQEEISTKDIYQIYQQRHIQLGPTYQWVDSIRRGDKEAVCQLKIPPILTSVVDEYQLHPGLIDTCFGLLVATIDIAVEETFIPFSVEKFSFYRRPSGTGRLWAYARLREENQESKWIGDIQIIENNDKIIAEGIGLEGKKATREVLLQSLQKDFSDWLYDITWQPKEREIPSQQLQSQGHWLIFADRNGIGIQLAQQLEAQGEHCVLVSIGETYLKEGAAHYYINPAEPRDYQRLFQESLEENQAAYQGIVHLWNLNESTPDMGLLGCGSVLHLVQALIQTKVPHLPQLSLVTQGAQPVSASPLKVQQSLVWGLGKVIALEHPDIHCVRLDMDPTAELNDNLKALFEEIRSFDKEDQIAWRQGIRYVPRLSKVRLGLQREIKILQDCSYLITGGLGALGLKVAHWLVAQGAKHLILTSRRGASEEIQATVNQLEQAGVQVLVIKADVSRPEEVERILETIKNSMPALRGIIHAAGVLDDGVLLQQTWARFRQVMAPKVAGTWNLHLLTQEIPLDFFVCFSSMASLLGSPAQGNYVVANTFMDALAHHRRALGLPSLSINWGPWAEVGMATKLGKHAQRRLTAQGLGSISLDDGLQILSELLGQKIAQIGVLPINWSLFLPQFSQGIQSPFLEAFTSQPSVAQKHGLLKQLEASPVTEHRTILFNHVRAEIAQVLELKTPEQIQASQKLFDELGIDSLMAVELKNRLQASLGRSLRSTLVFDYPTLESLVDHLSQELAFSDEMDTQLESRPDSSLAELEQLSESEAEALLLKELEKI
jgi:malonyl CoA-acyl carrier protein transacylase